MDADRFLQTAFDCLKSRGVMHFYSIQKHEKGLERKEADRVLLSEPRKKIEEAATKASKKVRIISKKKVLPYSPGSWKVCLDAEVGS
jgi:tRNA G37 N-methylase Trm5